MTRGARILALAATTAALIPSSASAAPRHHHHLGVAPAAAAVSTSFSSPAVRNTFLPGSRVTRLNCHRVHRVAVLCRLTLRSDADVLRFGLIARSRGTHKHDPHLPLNSPSVYLTPVL